MTLGRLDAEDDIFSRKVVFIGRALPLRTAFFGILVRLDITYFVGLASPQPSATLCIK